MCMKKIISILCVAIMLLSLSFTALAGDVPEGLLGNDEAQVFFGEVVSYEPDGEIPYVEVIPTKKIKGDVIVDGSCATWQFAEKVGNFDVVPGKQYLFTWFDGNNPTNIFDVTSFDTKTLKLKNVTGDMWERFEKYLNDGEYEKAEQERLNNPKPVNNEQKAERLSQLFDIDRSEVEKVEVIYPAENDPYGCYVDVDSFFDIAEKIILSPTEEPNPMDTDGIFIIALDKDENRHSIWLDKHARVDKEIAMATSILSTGYSISEEDYIKLYEFLPEEATAHIPLKEKPMNVFFFIMGFALVGAIIGASAGFVFYIIRKKKGASK